MPSSPEDSGSARRLLRTQRLALRPLTLADIDNLVELDSDPEVMRYLNGGAPTPRGAIERDILPGFLGSYAPGGPYGVWALVEPASGAFIGWASLRLDDERLGEATLGYRLRRAAWGKGYATEAVRALLAAAFRDPTLQRVTATTFQDNRSSRRVMEKAGLRFARAYHFTPSDFAASAATYIPAQDIWNGEDVEYVLEKSDWERARAAEPRRS